MQTLMISLDKKALDPQSAVATRLLSYTQLHPLHVMVPSIQEQQVDLAESVTVYSSGGKTKGHQFMSLLQQTKKILQDTQTKHITTQDPFFTGVIGVLAKPRGGTVEVQVHGDVFHPYFLRGGIMAYLRRVVALYVLKRADTIRVVSERIEESLLARGIAAEHIRVEPITVQSAKVDSSAARAVREKRAKNDGRLFLVLGRHEPIKNVDFALTVFAKHIDAGNRSDQLLIVGEGSQTAQLKKQAEALGVAHNVQFESWTKTPDVYLAAADCLLFPSHAEGYGLVVQEALAQNCAVIMNAVGVAGYEVQSSDTVHIITTKRQQGWITAMNQIKRRSSL